MKAAEFKRVFALADSNEDLSEVDDSILSGCGLREFIPVVATVRQCARLLRDFRSIFKDRSGGSQWDMEALNEMRDIYRRKVTLLD